LAAAEAETILRGEEVEKWRGGGSLAPAIRFVILSREDTRAALRKRRGPPMSGFAKRLTSSIAERLASTWLLLSDTTNFLSRTSIFSQYEPLLRELRMRLGSSRGNSDELRDIRKELTDLREALRLQGYDLSLGKLELSVKGFRNDAAVAEGFRRMVLFIGDRNLWYIVGEDNHNALHDHLESECERRGISDVRQKHYLWFRWNHSLLMISGADSETAGDFRELQSWVELPEHRLLMLAKLKRAR
jgi:hypothetical protein